MHRHTTPQGKLLALPTIVNGSIAHLLSVLPAVYAAPLAQADQLDQLRAAGQTAAQLSASADMAWRQLQSSLRKWGQAIQSPSPHTPGAGAGASGTSAAMPRFQEVTAHAQSSKTSTVVATLGPVASQAAAIELCHELDSTVCGHKDLLAAFGAGLGGCHACGWTRSVIQGDDVFLLESMVDADTCQDTQLSKSTTGVTLCAYPGFAPTLVHCCM